MENIKLDNEISNEVRIIQIFNRAMNLFKKTGLDDLAEKWDKIIKTYINREHLSEIS